MDSFRLPNLPGQLNSQAKAKKLKDTNKSIHQASGQHLALSLLLAFGGVALGFLGAKASNHKPPGIQQQEPSSQDKDVNDKNNNDGLNLKLDR